MLAVSDLSMLSVTSKSAEIGSSVKLFTGRTTTVSGFPWLPKLTE